MRRAQPQGDQPSLATAAAAGAFVPADFVDDDALALALALLDLGLADALVPLALPSMRGLDWPDAAGVILSHLTRDGWVKRARSVCRCVGA